MQSVLHEQPNPSHKDTGNQKKSTSQILSASFIVRPLKSTFLWCFATAMAKYGRGGFQSSVGELDCRCRGIPILNTYIWSKFTKKWIQLIGKLGYEIKKTSGKTSIQNLVRRRRFSMF